jgi:hypothetical protein
MVKFEATYASDIRRICPNTYENIFNSLGYRLSSFGHMVHE